ncbi:glutamate-rich WD repeat containing [Rhizophagus clarus]|uniref:Glutamate-rich WD repeat-containing protein 1 n=1 Tax=Rhizophagus clarus TaxID=94130 RepID=A0A8H3QUB5_9GLOM|nr:glutamate-rich WD repeat containing [Rhizophagus clarus]
MSKRTTEDMDISDFQVPKAPFGQTQEKIRSVKELEGMGEFEDPWEDEYETESEEEVVEEDNDEDKEGDEMDIEETEELQVYLPGQELQNDEVLEADQSAYEMLHSMDVRWPCLSFDILWDNLGEDRKMYPATAYIVAGTQADKPKNNELMIMKMSQLHKTQNDDNFNDSDKESDDETNNGKLDEDPILEEKSLKHYGGVNRVRVTPQKDLQIAASWADTGKVHIWDLSPIVKALDTRGYQISQKSSKPLYTIESHSTEGFAMDWSGTVPGRLITGDNHTYIYLTTKTQSNFTADRIPFVGHSSSVEDLQWSPNEKNVFASASADQTVRIWDTRNKKKDALCVKAHDADVNVITWNRKVDYLLASGSDDGVISIWDLRTFTNKETKPSPVANFKWHSAPITSIEWHPTEESIFGASGADDQISIWDLSVEYDPEENSDKIIGKNGVEVPPQLLFVHQGQNDIKEVHWHPQISGCNPEKDMSNNEDLVIDVESLNFTFGESPVLDNVNLKLQKGARCLLVGANGAGKSTLLTILAGKRMVQDKVLVFGMDAFKDSPLGITYLGTEWANNPVVKGDLYPERVNELIQIMDINPKWRMHQISDGERRRVQLVLGLIKPWVLLLMDEVTVDLDVLVRSDLLQFLKNETEKRNATIVYATHIFDGLGDWPTHIAHIKRGNIVAFHDFHKNFPELENMISSIGKQQLTNNRNMGSPLLKVVEQWLREDLRELRLLQAEERKKAEQERDKVLLGEEKAKTKWDVLSDDVDKYGDKYYNYWNH